MGSTSDRRRAVIERSLGRFCVERGLPADLRTPALVEAFCAMGLGSRATSTAGTYRSVLRSEEKGKRSGRPYPAGRAPEPYSPQECAELFATARSQPRQWRRESALALLLLSLGAGLRPGEIVAARGVDVRASARTVSVFVGARQVRVRARYARPLIALARRRGSEHLFHPDEADRAYPNFVSDFTAHLRRGPGVRAFSLGRARATFICAHLERGTPLSLLIAETGISDVASLLRYCRHVPGAPQSKSALRAKLRAERREG
jgi:integrase